MNSAKVKAKRDEGCCSGFGTFQEIYPQNLYGVMEPNEFETTIRTLNSKTETKMPKKLFFCFIPVLIGVILCIAGFAKFASADPSNQDTYDSNGPVFIGIGIAFTFVGCIAFGIGMCIFQKGVTNKIKKELTVINKHYASRRIKWTLETEIVEEYVDPHEYEVHKNNKAYRNGIVYDKNGRPMKRTTVYFILIVFP
ncbi:hypothetical protein DICPUDRAFT_20813, partial [Dictyostelium purpureum]